MGERGHREVVARVLLGKDDPDEEMFEAADIRPFSATDISAANRRHDEMLAHNPWFKLWQAYGVCLPA